MQRARTLGRQSLTIVLGLIEQAFAMRSAPSSVNFLQRVREVYAKKRSQSNDRLAASFRMRCNEISTYLLPTAIWSGFRLPVFSSAKYVSIGAAV